MGRRVVIVAVLILAVLQVKPDTGAGEKAAPPSGRDPLALGVAHRDAVAAAEARRDPVQGDADGADAPARDRRTGDGGGDSGGGAGGGSGRPGRGGHPQEAADFRIQVGAISPEHASLPFEYTRFYPDHLRVHRGQTVQFDSLNFHTASFPAGGENGRRAMFRRDEGPSGFAITEAAWQRSDCGGPDQPPCVLDDPDDEFSSGFPVWDLTWRVRIDRPAGTTVTYVCQFHPGMTASIEVVDDAKPLPTQGAIDAKVRKEIARDTQEAIDHRAKLDARAPHREEGGRTIWTVLVGASTPSRHVSILGYMPQRLDRAQPGDAVEFVSSGPAGHHSVTFPSVLVGDNEISPNNRLTLAAIHPACDFDERASGAPGIPAPYDPFTPLPCPASLEFLPSPYLTRPHPSPKNLVATPATYHDSGLMWSDEAPEYARGRPAGSGDYFPHRFVAEFATPGEFQYACTIHGADFMAGTIHVGGVNTTALHQRRAPPAA